MAESYDWVYENIKSDLNLASISGAPTSCPASRWRRHAAGLPRELQCRGLGMAVDIYDELGRRCTARKASWSA
ncbi:acetoacetyl-CoA synthetase [Chromobacterium violaceum]|uniref:Acetoacetyl-CoA synthetase n=1 Tax=Chromobacterium violaceum TaxID=536 RepID=A0A3S5DLE4_CHRVL|nr:acetoacetyl-CoA synthetase [Chromobacterium violaceum]